MTKKKTKEEEIIPRSTEGKPVWGDFVKHRIRDLHIRKRQHLEKFSAWISDMVEYGAKGFAEEISLALSTAAHTTRKCNTPFPIDLNGDVIFFFELKPAKKQVNLQRMIRDKNKIETFKDAFEKHKFLFAHLMYADSVNPDHNSLMDIYKSKKIVNTAEWKQQEYEWLCTQTQFFPPYCNNPVREKYGDHVWLLSIISERTLKILQAEDPKITHVEIAYDDKKAGISSNLMEGFDVLISFNIDDC